MKHTSPSQFENATAVPLIGACVLAIGPALGLGMGRFAYSLLLPAMRSDLHWTYSQAGSLNTWNAVGYLLGAFVATRVMERLGVRRAFILSCCSVCILLGGTAATSDLLLLNAIRFFLGLAAAFSFVGGGTMVTTLARNAGERGELLLGVFYAGTGAGILLSGLITPSVLAGSGSWPAGWLALAAAASMLFAAAVLVGVPRALSSRVADGSRKAPHVKLAALYISNVLYGAGYIGYMTFMIAFVRDGGHHEAVQTMFWSLIGMGAVVAPWLWSGVIRRGRGGRAIALLTLVTIAGASLPLLSTSLPWLFASALVFGCAFFAVIAAFVSFVRKNVRHEVVANAIGMATAAVGFGQIAGPVLVGTVTDYFGGLRSGLWLSIAILGVAAVIALVQRDLEQKKPGQTA